MKKNLALLLAMMLGLSNAAFAAEAGEETTSEVSEGEGMASAEETVKQEVGEPVSGVFKHAQMMKAGELFDSAKEAGDTDMIEALIAHFKKAKGPAAQNIAARWQKQLDAMKAAE